MKRTSMELAWSSLSIFFMAGCGGPSNAGAGAVATVDGGQIAASACVSPLVWLKTGPDSNCGGQSTHAWPVGMKTTDCHGWRAVDTSGRQHDNSANDIRCNADGSFSFVQFAGNLNCAGSGVRKDYTLNTCEQDRPPSLYTVAVDLTCCRNPSDPECRSEVPSVSVAGGQIFKNGAACVP
jgi:hypothetical protein